MQFPLMPSQMLNLLLAQWQCSNLGPSPYPTTTPTTSEWIKPLAVAGGRLPFNIRQQQQPQTQSTPTPTALAPLLDRDFPDPSIIYDVDAQTGIGTYYAFATASSGRNIQAASAASPSGPWTYIDGDGEILPSPGNWTLSSSPGSFSSGGGNTWAPDVHFLRPNHYIMYYSGQLAGNNSAYHCIGAATSNSVLGPYTAMDEPIACPLSRGGAIDPSGFVDEETGRRYLLYKIDGNSLGNGGECNNGVAPYRPTPIILQQVNQDDGVSLIGDPVEILDRLQEEDGPLVEAPSLVRVLTSPSNSDDEDDDDDDDGERKAIYVLFYSSHCWMTDLYRVNYATAENVTGPYRRAGDGRPLIWTGSGGFNLTAPGGATGWSTDHGRGRLVFHADCEMGRCLFEMGFEVRIDGGSGNVSVVATGTN
ncbi:Glycosyl hydrolase, five-bladed beta-propellor domain containing protein [Rhypophila sp. PSN 637]